MYRYLARESMYRQIVQQSIYRYTESSNKHKSLIIVSSFKSIDNFDKIRLGYRCIDEILKPVHRPILHRLSIPTAIIIRDRYIIYQYTIHRSICNFPHRYVQKPVKPSLWSCGGRAPAACTLISSLPLFFKQQQQQQQQREQPNSRAPLLLSLLSVCRALLPRAPLSCDANCA